MIVGSNLLYSVLFNVCAKTAISLLHSSEKTQFTYVNEYFSDFANLEPGLFSSGT